MKTSEAIGDTAAMICAVFALTGFFVLAYAALTNPPVEVLIIEEELGVRKQGSVET